MDFKSDGEGVQITERNPADKIYKATETKKVVLLQRISFPSSEFSSLISWWEVLYIPKNVAQQDAPVLELCARYAV